MSDSLEHNNARCKDNIWPVSWDSIFVPEPAPLIDGDKRRHHRSAKWRRLICCPCLPFCTLLLLCISALVLAALAVLVFGLIAMNRQTTTVRPTSMFAGFGNMTSATFALNTSLEYVETTVLPSTTAEHPSSSTTATTTLLVPILALTNTSTTQTTSTTTSTISTTTTSPATTTIYCGPSCLNQSWIDPSGVLSLWRYDNSFNDATNTFNGDPTINPPTFVPGYFGQAASFDAALRQAVYTSFMPLRDVSFTIEAWIHPTGLPNPTDESIVGLCPLQVADDCLHINIRNGKLYFGFYYNDVEGATTITLGRWIHTAFVFDLPAMTLTIYLNGMIDGQATVTSALLVSSGNVTIGTNDGVALPDNFFQGYIDQVSANSRSKSSCEILEIATLAAHFKFDTSAPSADSGPNAVPTTSSSVSPISSGRFNQAIAFSGSSTSYFQASGFTSLADNDQPFSITFWIQPQTLSGTLVHHSSSSAGTGANCFPLLGFAATGAIVAQVLTSSGNLATATGPVLSTSSSSWIHVVQTWSSGSGLRLYVNGTLVASAGAGTSLGSGTALNYLTLGSCVGGCGGCLLGGVGVAGGYTGTMDDWRIYIREITSEDVCTLYYAK